MIDIKLIRENPDMVKENIRKKFQDHKLELVDKVLELDKKNREVKLNGDELRSSRNTLSSQIGNLMKQGNREEAEKIKAEVNEINSKLVDNEKLEEELAQEIKEIMMKIPNIIDDSVPIGRDDSENVEIQKFGDPFVPDYEIPYHTDIMESLSGIDLDSARRVAGNGFYYLIGTSEHSMIGKFKGQILQKQNLPYTMTSYSPCFRKEKGAHGLEERGVYRIHQFEKQEMIVVCEPEESYEWYDKMWSYTVELFRSLEIPVRTLECCSGDLADLKAKSCDVEAWSPRQKKYFEVGSCSNLTDAQSRRLGIRVKGEKGNYFPHTLNNTVVAPPRMLIAFLENHYQADGSITIPEVLRPYMGGAEILRRKV